MSVFSQWDNDEVVKGQCWRNGVSVLRTYNPWNLFDVFARTKRANLMKLTEKLLNESVNRMHVGWTKNSFSRKTSIFLIIFQPNNKLNLWKFSWQNLFIKSRHRENFEVCWTQKFSFKHSKNNAQKIFSDKN